jgi:hypothetical protein
MGAAGKSYCSCLARLGHQVYRNHRIVTGSGVYWTESCFTCFHDSSLSTGGTDSRYWYLPNKIYHISKLTGLAKPPLYWY